MPRFFASAMSAPAAAQLIVYRHARAAHPLQAAAGDDDDRLVQLGGQVFDRAGVLEVVVHLQAAEEHAHGHRARALPAGGQEDGRLGLRHGLGGGCSRGRGGLGGLREERDRAGEHDKGQCENGPDPRNERIMAKPPTETKGSGRIIGLSIL